jgi:enoyl-CoA hydratase/carnithine racemase
VTRALIRVRREGAVYVLELCAGENLVHHAFLDAMHTALDEVEQSQGPAAFVITGEGKFYSTGFDQAALADPDVAADIVERAVQLCARLLALPVPSCAAINGHAFGIGAMIGASSACPSSPSAFRCIRACGRSSSCASRRCCSAR